MTRLSLAYLAGALTVAGAVFAAAGRLPLVTFGLGVFVALVALGAALSSPARIRRAVRFLSAVAQVIEITAPEPASRPQIAARPRLVETGAEADLVSALTNLGAGRAAARAAASRAIEQTPGASFDRLLQTAVALSRKAAA
jgi:hypothetical protein